MVKLIYDISYSVMKRTRRGKWKELQAEPNNNCLLQKNQICNAQKSLGTIISNGEHQKACSLSV
jgi:hypothetical protein